MKTVRVTLTITEKMVKQYVFLSGDNNSIHQGHEKHKISVSKKHCTWHACMGLGVEDVAAPTGKSCVISEYEMDFLKIQFS